MDASASRLSAQTSTVPTAGVNFQGHLWRSDGSSISASSEDLPMQPTYYSSSAPHVQVLESLGVTSTPHRRLPVGVSPTTALAMETNVAPGFQTLPGSCSPYPAEQIQAAIQHLQQLMTSNAGMENMPQRPSQTSPMTQQPLYPVGTSNMYQTALENLGSASTGLPRPVMMSLDSPLMKPPDPCVFPVAPVPLEPRVFTPST